MMWVRCNWGDVYIGAPRKQLYLNLEANCVTVVRALRHNGDDTEGIGKRFPVLLVVCDFQLKFGSSLDGLAHAMDGNLVNRFYSIGRVPRFAVRDLQEAAVASKDLVHGVASELTEWVGGVNYRGVGLLQVAHDEGNGAVNRTELNLRVRARHDLEKDRHHVETGGWVETRVDDRILDLPPSRVADMFAVGLLAMMGRKLIVKSPDLPGIHGWRRAFGRHSRTCEVECMAVQVGGRVGGRKRQAERVEAEEENEKRSV
jgi:hypothetical protein